MRHVVFFLVEVYLKDIPFVAGLHVDAQGWNTTDSIVVMTNHVMLSEQHCDKNKSIISNGTFLSIDLFHVGTSFYLC